MQKIFTEKVIFQELQFLDIVFEKLKYDFIDQKYITYFYTEH